ncbi:MAG: hypothetical protein ACK559_37585, partial [bacterium]
MREGHQLVHRLIAHAVGGAVRRGELGQPLLDLEQLAVQQVVRAVVDLGGAAGVVEVAVAPELGLQLQPPVAGLGVREGRPAGPRPLQVGVPLERRRGGGRRGQGGRLSPGLGLGLGLGLGRGGHRALRRRSPRHGAPDAEPISGPAPRRQGSQRSQYDRIRAVQPSSPAKIGARRLVWTTPPTRTARASPASISGRSSASTGGRGRPPQRACRRPASPSWAATMSTAPRSS